MYEIIQSGSIEPAACNIVGLPSLPTASLRAQFPQDSQINDTPLILRERSSVSLEYHSLPTLHAKFGDMGASAAGSILSLAEMSAIFLPLPTYQDKEAIATRIETSLRQNFAVVKQSLSILKSTVSSLQIERDSVVQRLADLESLYAYQRDHLLLLRLHQDDL